MIEVRNVSFSYTPAPFIRDVSFSVAPGEIFGFLGPSGAGKSTLQKIMTGLLPGFSGSVVVAGHDVRLRSRTFYEKIGVDFEYPTLYEKLTARENLEFFASLYARKTRSAEELLALVGLSQDADKKAGAFSKGMKSRLNFAKSLAHGPEVLFLDEPTSGLDPANAREMKAAIRAERDAGRAVILTTHNMHDAAELCDRVAFIVDGTVRALDTPRNLARSRGAARIRYTWLESGSGNGDGGGVSDHNGAGTGFGGQPMQERSAEIQCDATGQDEIFLTLAREGRLLSVHSLEPTLEDIFIDVTGRGLS